MSPSLYSYLAAQRRAGRRMWPFAGSPKAVNAFRGWSTPKDTRASLEWNCRCLKSCLTGIGALMYSMLVYAVGDGPISSVSWVVALGVALLFMHRSYYCMAQVARVDERSRRRSAARKRNSRY